MSNYNIYNLIKERYLGVQIFQNYEGLDYVIEKLFRFVEELFDRKGYLDQVVKKRNIEYKLC